jgi:hypothetical protein
VALHGVVNGSAATEVVFTGKAGQKIRVEIEATRLGSKLRPVVHLTNAKRLQLAWSWPMPALHGDTRLEATLPEDGKYTLSIHDLEYAAPGPSFFRLRVGLWSFVDHVFPPVVEKGRTQTIEFLGTSPAVSVNINALSTGPMPVSIPKGSDFSGPRPFVLVSPHAEVVKQVVPGKMQELPVGLVGVSGRLLKPYDEDRYRIPVKPNTKLRLEVFAERYGSPLDAALVVRNEQGAELARVEDSPGTLDPILEYNVPATVTAVVVGVVDSQGRGGSDAVYRLVVEPARTGPGKKDFQLFTLAQQIALPPSGRAVLPIQIERVNYEGRIELLAEGLPPGVHLEGADVPEGADGALVTIRRGTAAAGAVITRWRGRTPDGEERTVAIKGHPQERLQPWLATEIALSASDLKTADLKIDWRGLPADASMVPAGKLLLPVKVTKPAGNSVVRLTLLTSQLRPSLPNGLPDPQQVLRIAAPVELPAMATDGELSVVVPPVLFAPVYDLMVQAELLTADKQKVLTVVSTPVRRMAVKHQIVVNLDGSARIETTASPTMATTVKVTGKVERREGLTGEVALTLTGMPPGVAAAPVNVKAGDTAFVLNVVLPPGTQAGAIAGLKLSGTGVADPKQPNVRVRSRDVDITLIVKQPTK